uniref:TLC domain-containing protein 2-like n=1 Tax=Seriola lalandi dorsalis TaxID=1841481 RepID=A0A3B4XQ84_SERLL
MDLRSTLLVIGGSVCSFKLLNTIVRLLPTPVQASKKAWRWRNISTSLAHSSLTGAWAVLCFYLQPQTVEDLISSHSVFSHSLVAVSTGYFINDLLDLAVNQSFKQSWELLFHHSVVISCFSVAVTTRLYLGFAVVSLLVEINSVFLHIRQLLLLSGQRNSWLNMGTFLVFRVCTLGWMARWLAGHSEHIPRYILMMGTAGLSLISTMNTVLFYRLLRREAALHFSRSKITDSVFYFIMWLRLKTESIPVLVLHQCILIPITHTFIIFNGIFLPYFHMEVDSSNKE